MRRFSAKMPTASRSALSLRSTRTSLSGRWGGGGGRASRRYREWAHLLGERRRGAHLGEDADLRRQGRAVHLERRAEDALGLAAADGQKPVRGDRRRPNLVEVVRVRLSNFVGSCVFAFTESSTAMIPSRSERPRARTRLYFGPLGHGLGERRRARRRGAALRSGTSFAASTNAAASAAGSPTSGLGEDAEGERLEAPLLWRSSRASGAWVCTGGRDPRAWP